VALTPDQRVTSPEQWARTVGARLARTKYVRRRISLAELLRADVVLRPEEALAIAQQLIHRSSASDPPPSRPNALPPGPPTPANVFLDGDGSVSCPGCEATLAVSEVAIFLQGILPSMPSHIVGSVRYLVARALLEVDAPPFDSLKDFSHALARHERGDREEVVRRLLDRARSDILARTGEAALVDRRRTVPGIAELRRELRERDERVYDQYLALNALQAMAAGEALYVWHRAPSRAPDQLNVLPALELQSRGLPAVDETRDARRLEWQTSETIGPSPDPSVAPSRPPAFVNIASSNPVAASSHRGGTSSSRPPSRPGSSPASAKRTAHEGVEPPVPAQRKHSLFTWLRSKIVLKVDPL